MLKSTSWYYWSYDCWWDELSINYDFNEVIKRPDYSIVRIHVDYKSSYVGKTISNIVLPNNAILIAIYDDNDEMVIPHGDTVIEAGQNILAFGDENAIKELNKLFIG